MFIDIYQLLIYKNSAIERNAHFLLSKKVTLDYYKRWIVRIILSLTLGVIAFPGRKIIIRMIL